MGVDYRVLGRLEVARDGASIDIGAYRQRALLALLLANAGTVLSTDRIIEALWSAPDVTDKQSSLWAYVSGLRGALEPNRPKRSEGTILLTRPPGYVLAIDPTATDVGRFERAVADARALADVDPDGASRTLRGALATWRGHPYEEFTYESWAQVEIGRLEELRLEAIEDRVEADLRLGRARQLVAELHALARQHPLRERFVASLMLALHRSGRTAEALRTHAAFRDRLAAETGLTPSRTLEELQHRILGDDPALLAEPTDRPAAPGSSDHPAVPAAPASGPTVRGYELRDVIRRSDAGTVYRAYQPVVGIEVAILVVDASLADDPAFVRRFEDETRRIAGLDHPHIEPLHDSWREPGAAYLVTRRAGVGTLRDELAAGPLPAERVVAVVASIADALEEAHRCGVVHGRLVLDDIAVGHDGSVSLTNFEVGGHADAASDVRDLALVAAAALTGDEGAGEGAWAGLPPAVRAVLRRATDPDPARRHPGAAAFGRALADALGSRAAEGPHDTVVANPYRGLRPFGEADAARFFGRERLVQRLVERLGRPGAAGRFLAVVGPSGSGKSSVVRAGLLAGLADGALASSATWYRVETTPAPDPFEQLESALLPLSTDPPGALTELLLAPGGVQRAVARVLPDGARLLLVVDQFEELYTQVDDRTAERFVDELVGLVSSPEPDVRLVVTLRADFYDRPLRHGGFGELLRDGTEVVTPMTAEELASAITGPAATVGVAVEPLVVSAMVREVADRPGALPLLQYALTELFDTRTDDTITLDAYRAGGGVSRALARRADALLLGFDPETTDTARRLLLRLVSLDDEGAGHTRRRALVAELEELDERGRVHRVLDTFGRHRLLSFDRDPVSRGPTVEISHEALLTEWTTMRRWVDDARDELRVHRQLATELHAWTAAGRSPDYLLRGDRLEAIAAWARSTTMGVRPAEREFLSASVDAQAAERREREVVERRSADAEARARRRARQLAIAALVVVLVGGLATFAWVQRDDARRAQADLADTQQAQRLAASALAALADDPELSLLVAMEAVRATADLGYALPEAVDATHWALQALGVQYPVAGDTATAARFGPDGVRGVWVLPVDELMALAESASDRRLTADECRRYVGADCPAAPADISGVEYLGGRDDYAGLVPLNRAEVVVGVAIEGGESDVDEWRRNLDALGDRHGLRVRLLQLPTTRSQGEAVARSTEADVYVVDPRTLPDLLAERQLVDVRAFVDEAALVDDYGAHLVSLGRVADDGTWPSDTGPVYGVVADAQSKAVVWTDEPELADLGDAPPGDWGSFMALAETIAADGRAPFCAGLESGDADGWPATDWVEMAVLRAAGPDLYDAWVDHSVPFDHPAVVDAIATIGAMVHRPGFLDVSPAQAADREFAAAMVELVDDAGRCLMVPMPSFMPAFVELAADQPVGVLPFPAFGAGYDDAVVGGAGLAVAVTDRPEVRAFVSALASPDWGVGSAELAWPLRPPANARFDPDDMVNPVMADIVAGQQAAIRSGTFRFDASDLMPAEVDAAFRAGMVRLFREGSLETVDELAAEIAADVEATWRRVEAPGG